MSDTNIIGRLFGPDGHRIRIEGHFLAGPARIADRPVAVICTWDAAVANGELALAVFPTVLAVVAEDAAAGVPPRPIVFIADTQGQELSRREERLGLNGCFAHVVRCLDLDRRRGHTTLTLIHGEAVSGGFLAFGLLADRICVLPDAQVRVMDLRAMTRVTKIPLERLQGLAVESPVFAPGADKYFRMDAVHEMWPHGAEDWDTPLAHALAAAEAAPPSDERAKLGEERCGQTLAAAMATAVGEA